MLVTELGGRTLPAIDYKGAVDCDVSAALELDSALWESLRTRFSALVVNVAVADEDELLVVKLTIEVELLGCELYATGITCVKEGKAANFLVLSRS